MAGSRGGDGGEQRRARGRGRRRQGKSSEARSPPGEGEKAREVEGQRVGWRLGFGRGGGGCSFLQNDPSLYVFQSAVQFSEFCLLSIRYFIF